VEDDDLQALHYFEQQKLEYDEWLSTDEAVSFINEKLIEASMIDKELFQEKYIEMVLL
jgi:hypothetical protein